MQMIHIRLTKRHKLQQNIPFALHLMPFGMCQTKIIDSTKKTFTIQL